MTDDDRSLEEIEARLDELRDEKDQADELGEAFADALDAFKSIQRHPLVDEPAAAKVRLLAAMLRHVQHHDVNPSKRIHDERRALREARCRKKAEAESEAET
jgi:hypothetical protein